MFDLSWSEILVIGTAAIIFIGPKELPGALRTAGQWMGRARALAREFQSSIDDMIRESELEKIKSEVDKLGSGDLQKHIENTIDPEGDINRALNTPVSLTEPGAPPAASPAPEPQFASEQSVSGQSAAEHAAPAQSASHQPAESSSSAPHPSGAPQTPAV
jgi:sec-independent protein translocase protein TatB